MYVRPSHLRITLIQRHRNVEECKLAAACYGTIGIQGQTLVRSEHFDFQWCTVEDEVGVLGAQKTVGTSFTAAATASTSPKVTTSRGAD